MSQSETPPLGTLSQQEENSNSAEHEENNLTYTESQNPILDTKFNDHDESSNNSSSSNLPKTPPSTPMPSSVTPMRSALKSRLLLNNNKSISFDLKNSDSPSSTSQQQSSQESLNSSNNKKSVKFNKVDLFLFDRCQGFTSIPSPALSTAKVPNISIGMSLKHSDSETFHTIDDYLKYKRKCDLEKLENYFYTKLGQLEKENERLKNKKKPSRKGGKRGASSKKTKNEVNEEPNSESKPDLVSIDPELNKINQILENKSKYEENLDEHLDMSVDIKCPILNTKERLSLLENLELEIDLEESHEIKNINDSRETCGCLCAKFNLVCGDPDNKICSCVQNEIMCQLDRFR
jgi:hypothetical protein